MNESFLLEETESISTIPTNLDEELERFGREMVPNDKDNENIMEENEEETPNYDAELSFLAQDEMKQESIQHHLLENNLRKHSTEEYSLDTENSDDEWKMQK